MPGLSDDEINALERASQKIDSKGVGLSDSDINKLEEESMPKIPAYNVMDTLEAGLAGAGKGVTLGYAPEIAGAVLGPEAETKYNKSLAKSPPIAFLGEMVGGGALGTVLGKVIPAGRAIQTAAGGALGAAQQIPEQNSDYDAVIERLKNAGIGSALGYLGSGITKEGIQKSANQAAFESLRPYKRDVKRAMERGNIQAIGKAALDEGIIGNVPRSSDTLLERTESKLQDVGKAKGALIDQIQQASDDFARSALDEVDNLPIDTKRIPKAGKTEYGVDVQKVRDSILAKLKQDPKLPDAKKFNADLQEFVDNFAEGEKYISVKDADQLKTSLKQHIKNWYSNPFTDQKAQVFNKTLYRTLNASVDDTANFLAKKFGLPIAEDLKKTKQQYGNLSAMQDILENRQIGDVANRMVSPSDYGAGGAAAIAASASGHGGPVSGAAGAAAASLNNFLRKYGSQIKAKQLNNIVEAMDRLGILAPTAQTFVIPGIEATSKLNLRKKALEK